MQALSNKIFNPSPDAELLLNQHLSSSLGEVTNRLHQGVGKSALATDVLVNSVHTGDVPASIVEEEKARKVAPPVATTPTTHTLKVSTTPSMKMTLPSVTVPTPVSRAPTGPLLASQDFHASIWDIPAPNENKLTQTTMEYTMIVPGNWRAHHDLYQRFGRAIYDPWCGPPAHLQTTDPYHFRLGLMAPAILASLEQEHHPASRIPLAHEYDRAYGPLGVPSISGKTPG